ncbi:MAG: AI-2E family transporter [Planctomycetaceae bacterium]
MDRKVFFAILLSLSLVGLAMLAFLIFQPFLLSLLWCAVLATVTTEAYTSLLRVFKGRRTLASTAMTLLVMILIIAPFLFVSLVFATEVQEIAAEATSGSMAARIERVEAHPVVQKLLGWAEEFTGEKVDLNEVLANVRARMQPHVARAASDAAGFLLGFLANLFFVLLALFYFYRDGPQMVEGLRGLLPLHRADRDVILQEIRQAIVASVRGGLVTAVIQGFLGFVILLLLGVGQPVLWAAVMAIGSLIPLVGTAIVWVPMAGVFFIQGEVQKALILVGYGFLVISMADNFLRPILVGRHMEVNALLLFFGILGGIAAFGFIGIVLGPVSVGFLSVSMRLFRREFRAAEGSGS